MGTALFIRNVPAKEKRAFKLRCVMDGVTMNDAARALIQYYIDNPSKLAAALRKLKPRKKP